MQSLIIPYKTQHYCEDVEYKNKLSEPGVGFFFSTLTFYMVGLFLTSITISP